MRKIGKRILSLLTAAALCACMLPTVASAAAEGVTVWSDTIGSGRANLVSVTMKPGRTGEVSLANNSVVESTGARTLIDNKNAQANTHVVAAIDGGFFDSYTSGAWKYPSNCPKIFNPVVTGGKLLVTGNPSTIGFTADGKVLVDWVDLGNEVRLGNGYSVGSNWGVNTYQSDPYAIMLFNDHLTLPINIPASSTMVFIENMRVTKITGGGTLTVPKGVDVLVYNSEVAAQQQQWGRFPEVGMSAKLVLTASGTSRDREWANVETAVAGGPLLVKDGVNVVNDPRNKVYFNESKQKPDVVLARAFIGVTASGDLVMGTVTASFNQIANWMVANGIREGVSMDGGASSMLYADGSGFVTAAGRNLASALVIVDRTNGGGLPAESNQAPGDIDVPSSWAVADIEAAIAAGLVPQNLQNSYREPISRQDFCLLVWKLIEKVPNLNSKLYSNPPVSFADTSLDQLLWCAQIGVIQGGGDGNFYPYNDLTRAQAAKILALTTQLFDVEDTGERYPFTDRNAFPGWDQGWIDFCGVRGILKGSDTGAFAPDGKFSREQAIMTVLRIYRNYGA